MDIGILGGTFDPIHCGHIIIAEEAMRRLELSRVIFVPAGQPWLKTDREITPAVHRIRMVEQAIGSNHCFELSTVETERRGPSYTVDTLAAQQQQLGIEARLFFLLGWDSLAELSQWSEPTKLVRICRLVAFTRVGISKPNLDVLEASVPGVIGSTVFLDIPPSNISSSDIRRRVVAGLSIRNLVPAGVERYINMHKLYRQCG